MFRARFLPAPPIVMGLFALWLLLLAGCRHNGDPFSYVKVSGKVTYEDGSLIPANYMEVIFISEGEAVGLMHPKDGSGLVDTKTGEFKSVTTHTPFDGVVRGKLKVTIVGNNHKPLPETIVPREYYYAKETPLEVDTDELPFILKVAKPSASVTEKQKPVKE